MKYNAPLFLAPVFLCFELVQLVAAERYLGIKQIESGRDPRERGPGELASFSWSAFIGLYWLWMASAVWYRGVRAQVVSMIVITLVGLMLRRAVGLKWVLVILTLEGAIRIGMLVSIILN